MAGVVLPHPVQRGLNHHHIGTRAAPPQRRPGIGLHQTLHRRIGHDFDVVAVVGAENIHRVVALLRQVLGPPLAEPLAGDGRPVAEFGSQRLHKAWAAEVVVEDIVHNGVDVLKCIPPVHKGLVVGSGIGDSKVVAPAPVKLRVNPVQGKGNDGKNVGPQGALIPGGIDL